MSAAKHTPGPWQVNHRDPLQVCDADGEERGCAPIAAVQTGNDGYFAAKANARLIAAAPDLLEALRRALDAGIGADGRLPSASEQARAAIAKATGSRM